MKRRGSVRSFVRAFIMINTKPLVVYCLLFTVYCPKWLPQSPPCIKSFPFIEGASNLARFSEKLFNIGTLLLFGSFLRGCFFLTWLAICVLLLKLRRLSEAMVNSNDVRISSIPGYGYYGYCYDYLAPVCPSPMSP